MAGFTKTLADTLFKTGQALEKKAEEQGYADAIALDLPQDDPTKPDTNGYSIDGSDSKSLSVQAAKQNKNDAVGIQNSIPGKEGIRHGSKFLLFGAAYETGQSRGAAFVATNNIPQDFKNFVDDRNLPLTTAEDYRKAGAAFGIAKSKEGGFYNARHAEAVGFNKRLRSFIQNEVNREEDEMTSIVQREVNENNLQFVKRTLSQGIDPKTNIHEYLNLAIETRMQLRGPDGRTYTAREASELVFADLWADLSIPREELQLLAETLTIDLPDSPRQGGKGSTYIGRNEGLFEKLDETRAALINKREAARKGSETLVDEQRLADAKQWAFSLGPYAPGGTAEKENWTGDIDQLNERIKQAEISGHTKTASWLKSKVALTDAHYDQGFIGNTMDELFQEGKMNELRNLIFNSPYLNEKTRNAAMQKYLPTVEELAKLGWTPKSLKEHYEGKLASNIGQTSLTLRDHPSIAATTTIAFNEVMQQARDLYADGKNDRTFSQAFKEAQTHVDNRIDKGVGPYHVTPAAEASGNSSYYTQQQPRTGDDVVETMTFSDVLDRMNDAGKDAHVNTQLLPKTSILRIATRIKNNQGVVVSDVARSWKKLNPDKDIYEFYNGQIEWYNNNHEDEIKVQMKPSTATIVRAAYKNHPSYLKFNQRIREAKDHETVAGLYVAMGLMRTGTLPISSTVSTQVGEPHESIEYIKQLTPNEDVQRALSGLLGLNPILQQESQLFPDVLDFYDPTNPGVFKVKAGSKLRAALLKGSGRERNIYYDPSAGHFYWEED